MCFGCSKEPSHRDSSFEYPQHTFWLRNNEIIFVYTLLSGSLLFLEGDAAIFPHQISKYLKRACKLCSPLQDRQTHRRDALSSILSEVEG